MRLFRLFIISTALASTSAYAQVEVFRGIDVEDDCLKDGPYCLISSAAPTIESAANASSAAYNDSELVRQRYSPIRTQKGFEAREKLIDSGSTVANFHAQIAPRKTAPVGIVSYKEEAGKAQLIIAFHGSEAKEDFTQANFFFRKVTNPELGIEGGIHRGFNDRYMQSREAMLDLIRATLEDHHKSAADVEFVLTGHSLGGALATLAAADLKTNFPGAENLKLVTFSSPRVVSHDGARSIEESIGKDRIIRVWRDGDIVPSIFLGIFGFKHVGYSVKLESKTRGKFSLQNHGLSSIVEEATSHAKIEPLPHEGYKTWLKRKMASVPRAIKTAFTKLLKRA